MEEQLNSTADNEVSATAHALNTPPATPEEELSRKHLVFALQSSLDLQRQLIIFFHHINRLVPCQGVRFHHSQSGLEILEGSQGKHQCSYDLSLGNEPLGKICFSRRKRFNSADMRNLESLLAALVLPIRNALHYRTALQAASRDPLTGLLNRRSLNDHLGREISRSRREQIPLALLVIDIDWFKRINDEIGHLAGDQVLIEVGRILSSSVRRSDIVFRYAGDEFVLLLPNMDKQGAEKLVRRINRNMKKMNCVYEGRQIEASLSIGSAILGEQMNEKTLFETADLNMLVDKARKHQRS